MGLMPSRTSVATASSLECACSSCRMLCLWFRTAFNPQPVRIGRQELLSGRSSGDEVGLSGGAAVTPLG